METPRIIWRSSTRAPRSVETQELRFHHSHDSSGCTLWEEGRRPEFSEVYAFITQELPEYGVVGAVNGLETKCSWGWQSKPSQCADGAEMVVNANDVAERERCVPSLVSHRDASAPSYMAASIPRSGSSHQPEYPVRRTFSGVNEDVWNEFLQYFENIAELNSWDPEKSRRTWQNDELKEVKDAAEYVNPDEETYASAFTKCPFSQSSEQGFSAALDEAHEMEMNLITKKENVLNTFIQSSLAALTYYLPYRAETLHNLKTNLFLENDMPHHTKHTTPYVEFKESNIQEYFCHLRQSFLFSTGDRQILHHIFTDNDAIAEQTDSLMKYIQFGQEDLANYSRLEKNRSCKELEETGKDWLRFSLDREGGMKQRRERKNNINNNDSVEIQIEEDNTRGDDQ
ncbi:unnamed protein product [Mytilus coruscus]|uniref:Uncharacterized protein n=1 Tax=Mytilus coruscus TaxID=42192 RepID=A0A6J8B7Z1_MYTCO|nr:unnamed protein product [Mytilus coruscus]